MNDLFKTLISVEQLDNLLDDDQEIVILDCRAKLGDPEWGSKAYLDNHIPGALYANLDVDLADPPNEHGRHPLPTPGRWLDTLRSWGITGGTQVVLYDDAGGPYAARAWWMFRWAGHRAVAVLDGGLHAWVTTYPDRLETGAKHGSEPSTYTPGPSLAALATTEEILADLDTGSLTLVDARTEERWAGHEEPIDPIAGHIPGAICLPFGENLTADGYFKSAGELRERFAHLTDRDTSKLVSYCGSGVTAAHNLLALEVTGIEGVRLYPDSWSGWITDPARPVETG